MAKENPDENETMRSLAWLEADNFSIFYFWSLKATKDEKLLVKVSNVICHVYEYHSFNNNL